MNGADTDGMSEFTCPNCGDRRKGGRDGVVWCLNSDCAYTFREDSGT